MKTRRYFAVVVLGLLLTTMAFSSGQEKTEVIKEYVEVVNIEMIVRALRNGQPVSGLQESDFILLENGKQIPITSFTEERRKIGTKELTLETPESTMKPNPNRFFLFYFWILDRGVKYEESLDYFFKNVYTEGDVVIFAINNKAIEITIPQQILTAREDLKQEIQRTADKWNSWIQNTMSLLEGDLMQYIAMLDQQGTEHPQLEIVLDKLKYDLEYAWKEYDYQYLNANTTKLNAIANSLKNIHLEKWGLVFFQKVSFPLFNLNLVEVALKEKDTDNKLIKILRPYTLRTKMPQTSNTFITDIQQAFISADATFHMFLPQQDAKLPFHREELEMTEVYSDWQETFKQIAVATGGEIVTGNILKTSLEKAVAREDVFYRLTYHPATIDKEKRKIDIRTYEQDIELFHVSRITVPKPAAIEISHASFENSILSLTLKGYLLLSVDNPTDGNVQLNISAADQDGQIVEYTKPLVLDGEESSISLKLNLQKGSHYTILISAIDNISGLKAEKTLSIDAE